MTSYQYRCADHGVFDVVLPMGAATACRDCPACGAGAIRFFSAPSLLGTRPGQTAAIDRAERSRTEPDVVTALPARGGRRPSGAVSDPRVLRLPRP